MTYADYIRLADLPQRHAQSKLATGPQYSEWTDTLRRLALELGTGCVIGLHGSRGGGKTQMAVQLCKARCKQESATENPNPYVVPALYCRAIQFFMAIKATYRPDAAETEDEVIRRYTRPLLLVIDEAHERPESTWAASLLTTMIDIRYAAPGHDTIILANCQTAEEFAALLGPSATSRAQEAGGFVDCSAWGSFR